MKKITSSSQLKSQVFELSTAGLSDRTDIESLRNTILVNVFSLTASVLMFALAVAAILRHSYTSAAILFSSAALSLLVSFVLKFTGNHKLTGNALIVILNATAIYYLFFGGIENTGIFLLFTLPPMLIFLRGAKIGGIFLIIFILSASALFFAFDGTLLTNEYSTPTKVIFLISFVTLSLFSLIHEFTRSYTQKKLMLTAVTDELTGLFNRRRIHEMISYEVFRSSRSKREFSLIMGDIDFFKAVNDTHGHLCGDAVLKHVSKILANSLRKQDIISRWGGEEFLILLPETPAGGSLVAAEKLRANIENDPLIWKGLAVPVTVSFGCVSYDSDEPHTEKDYIEMTDKALYHAKQHGRNRVSRWRDISSSI